VRERVEVMGKSTPVPTGSEVAQWMARLRAALFEAVTEDDIREIAAGLVRKAKAGDLAAAKLLMTYVLGGGNNVTKVQQAVIVQDHGGALAPLPAPPVRVLPGTADKVEAMARRAANGQELFHAKDRKTGEA
jgi:hypothetical protein